MSNTSTLIDAATILMVRDVPGGLEVFMVVRHHQIDFASGALVFPGGKVDAADRLDHLKSHCRTSQNLSDREYAFRLAAIREAYEESGILLARRRGADSYVSAQELAAMEKWRDGLNDRSATLIDIASAEDLEFDLDALGHYAHWITPDMMPKRFDTHFYLARSPHGHDGAHDGSESVDSVWIRPQEALGDAASGARTIIFPTRMNIEMLAQYENVDAAFNACGKVTTVEPFLKKEEDGTVFLRIQPDAGYGDPKEPVERLK